MEITVSAEESRDFDRHGYVQAAQASRRLQVDDENGSESSHSLDFRALIQQHQREVEELKRACAREDYRETSEPLTGATARDDRSDAVLGGGEATFCCPLSSPRASRQPRPRYPPELHRHQQRNTTAASNGNGGHQKINPSLRHQHQTYFPSPAEGTISDDDKSPPHAILRATTPPPLSSAMPTVPSEMQLSYDGVAEKELEAEHQSAASCSLPAGSFPLPGGSSNSPLGSSGEDSSVVPPSARNRCTNHVKSSPVVYRGNYSDDGDHAKLGWPYVSRGGREHLVDDSRGSGDEGARRPPPTALAIDANGGFRDKGQQITGVGSDARYDLPGQDDGGSSIVGAGVDRNSSRYEPSRKESHQSLGTTARASHLSAIPTSAPTTRTALPPPPRVRFSWEHEKIKVEADGKNQTVPRVHDIPGLLLQHRDTTPNLTCEDRNTHLRQNQTNLGSRPYSPSGYSPLPAGSSIDTGKFVKYSMLATSSRTAAEATGAPAEGVPAPSGTVRGVSETTGCWGISGVGWRGGRGDAHGGDNGRFLGGEAFRSATWAENLVSKREEQSVLVRQLERELASTVSALRDERRERRGQTEVLRAKLEDSKGIVREREAELERREAMARTLMGELESLQSRCDRLATSREERSREAETTINRLREDNRELETRVRESEATAAEARAARESADEERQRVTRELGSAQALSTAAERRAETAELSLASATGLAQAHQKALFEAKDECQQLRAELQTLKRRDEDGGIVESLRAQVADLERQLLNSNQRCAALEARQGLLEKELVMAEGGEVEARAQLRRAVGRSRLAVDEGIAQQELDGARRAESENTRLPLTDKIGSGAKKSSVVAEERETGETTHDSNVSDNDENHDSEARNYVTGEGDGQDAVYAHNPKDAGSRETQDQPRRPQQQGGSGSGGWRRRDEAGEESAVRAADDYKEAPALFPPGWRKRSGSINVREYSPSSADGGGYDTGERSAARWRRWGSSRNFSAASAGGTDGGNGYHERGAGHVDARDAVRYVASAWIDGYDGGGDNDERHAAAFRNNDADDGSKRAQRERDWDAVGRAAGKKGDTDKDRSRLEREGAAIRAAAAVIADSFGDGSRIEARGETWNRAFGSDERKDATSASRCQRLPRARAPEANTVAAAQDGERRLPREGEQETEQEGLLKESPDGGRDRMGVYGIVSYESQREGSVAERTPLMRRERGAGGVHELTSESEAREGLSAERPGRRHDGFDAGCVQQCTHTLESSVDSTKHNDGGYSNRDMTGIAGNDTNSRTSTNGAQRREETRVLASLSHMGFTAEGNGSQNVNATATGNMNGDDDDNIDGRLNYRLHENGIATAPADSTDRGRRAFKRMPQVESERWVTGRNNVRRVKVVRVPTISRGVVGMTSRRTGPTVPRSQSANKNVSLSLSSQASSGKRSRAEATGRRGKTRKSGVPRTSPPGVAAARKQQSKRTTSSSVATVGSVSRRILQPTLASSRNSGAMKDGSKAVFDARFLRANGLRAATAGLSAKSTTGVRANTTGATTHSRAGFQGGIRNNDSSGNSLRKVASCRSKPTALSVAASGKNRRAHSADAAASIHNEEGAGFTPSGSHSTADGVARGVGSREAMSLMRRRREEVERGGGGTARRPAAHRGSTADQATGSRASFRGRGGERANSSICSSTSRVWKP